MTDKAMEQPPFEDGRPIDGELDRLKKEFDGHKTAQEQIKELADYILEHEPHEITDGGAIDVAIKIIKERPLPSEVLIMFCGWLTSRKETTCMGADHDAANVVHLYEMFIEANDWAEPREGFELTIKHPEEE